MWTFNHKKKYLPNEISQHPHLRVKYVQGCCSLCARVCHEGHDVGYSRKSSFFCDCGAEAATANEQGRMPCKCLSHLSEDTIRALYDDKPKTDDMTLSEDRVFSETFADLMIRGFHSEFKRSLQLLVDEARLSQWHETILQLFYICHKNTPSSTTDFS